MNEPTLNDAWAQAWDLLGQAIAEDRSPLRLVTLATVDADTTPRLRTVVLREVDASAQTLCIFTDARSNKVRELGNNNAASVHLWAPDQLIQLRLSGTVKITSGTSETAHWKAVPDHMREAYAHVPSPGTPIDAPRAWHECPSIENFAKITLHVHHLDIVCLSREGHWRVEYARKNKWKGDWLSP